MVMVILAFSCTTKVSDGFEITGNIHDLPDGKVLLKKLTDGSWQTVDSTSASSGRFTFRGKTEAPEMFRILLADSLPAIAVFVDNHEITISGSSLNLSEIKISGSKAHEEYDRFRDAQKIYKNKLDSLSQSYKKAEESGDRFQMQKTDSLFEKASEEKLNATRAYVINNKTSVISPYLAWTTLIYNIEIKDLEAITSAFDTSLNKSPYVHLLNDYISALKKVTVGNPAIDFTMNDPSGHPVSLSSFYGHYMLVDFWASWCPACRQENPNVVEAYRKFHSKGFDVLGVSLDKNKESWVKAIKEDKLIWNHVSDLKRWGSNACRLYGIKSIPSNILLDSEGVIIAKNLRGEALLKKLKELIK